MRTFYKVLSILIRYPLTFVVGAITVKLALTDKISWILVAVIWILYICILAPIVIVLEYKARPPAVEYFESARKPKRDFRWKI